MKFREKIEDVDCLQSIIITLLCLLGIFLMCTHAMFELCVVNSSIVCHDYGQVFTSLDEWRDWRIDHEGK